MSDHEKLACKLCEAGPPDGDAREYQREMEAHLRSLPEDEREAHRQLREVMSKMRKDVANKARTDVPNKAGDGKSAKGTNGPDDEPAEVVGAPYLTQLRRTHAKAKLVAQASNLKAAEDVVAGIEALSRELGVPDGWLDLTDDELRTTGVVPTED